MGCSLVTGSTGFIGQHLVERLLREGMPVVALARPQSAIPVAWSGRVAAVVANDYSPASILKAIGSRSIAQVFHLAAYGVRAQRRDVETMFRVNVELPARLVELAAVWGASVVAAGTCAEYAPSLVKEPLAEDAPLDKGSLYGSAKAAGGLLANAVASENGVQFRYLRLFNVYGPGEASHRLLPSLVAGLKYGLRVPLSEGRQIRDFVHVDDAVDAMIAALRDTREGTLRTTAIWNVCSGTGRSVRDFASAVAHALGKPMNLLAFGEVPMRKDDLPWLVGNSTAIERDIGWHPSWDFAAGVASAASRLAMSDERMVLHD